ncbi:MAG: GIY-YIG nuclease family protein [Phycisphaerae bacterium]
MSEVRSNSGDGGVYLAVFRLRRPRRILVGRLGTFHFPAGFYFYVGSAKRGLEARLARHARQDKPLRWHIDYLSTLADMLGAVVSEGTDRAECELACEVAKLYPRFIAGFGSSDCRCGGHLFHCPTLAPPEHRYEAPKAVAGKPR